MMELIRSRSDYGARITASQLGMGIGMTLPEETIFYATTVATSPSRFTNAADNSALLLGELAIRLAPGQTNFEKCPM
jgi:hypothetical protein